MHTNHKQRLRHHRQAHTEPVISNTHRIDPCVDKAVPHALRSRPSARPPLDTNRTAPCTARGLDDSKVQDGDLARRTSRKRAAQREKVRGRKQGARVAHRSVCVQRGLGQRPRAGLAGNGRTKREPPLTEKVPLDVDRCHHAVQAPFERNTWREAWANSSSAAAELDHDDDDTVSVTETRRLAPMATRCHAATHKIQKAASCD